MAGASSTGLNPNRKAIIAGKVSVSTVAQTLSAHIGTTINIPDGFAIVLTCIAAKIYIAGSVADLGSAATRIELNSNGSISYQVTSTDAIYVCSNASTKDLGYTVEI